MKTPKGARILQDSEVPQPGDFCRWSQSKRDEWREIPKGDTLRSGLPVATIRVRCGNGEMQFCTFSKSPAPDSTKRLPLCSRPSKPVLQ